MLSKNRNSDLQLRSVHFLPVILNHLLPVYTRWWKVTLGQSSEDLDRAVLTPRTETFCKVHMGRMLSYMLYHSEFKQRGWVLHMASSSLHFTSLPIQVCAKLEVRLCDDTWRILKGLLQERLIRKMGETSTILPRVIEMYCSRMCNR